MKYESLNTEFPDTNEKLIDICREYSLYTWIPQKMAHPVPIKTAYGCWYEDFEGKKYFDLSSQLVCVNIGYGQKKVADAIKEQVDILPYVKPMDTHAARAAASKKLIEMAPKGFKKVLFSLGGADANEYAIKLAKQITGKTKILSQYGSYHGSTYGASNLCGDSLRGSAIPQIPGFIKFFGPNWKRARDMFPAEDEACKFYLGMLEDQILYEGPEHIAGIWHETITGTGSGIIMPPKNYYKGVRALCDKYNIIMVLDEVMAGFGRSGKLFAFEHYGVMPDLVTFAKGITSSYAPLGGVLISEKIADLYDDIPMNGGLTYSSHGLGCVAAIANLEVYEEQHLIENSEKQGNKLKEGFEKLVEKHSSLKEVRGIGLFQAVQMIDKLSDKENTENMFAIALEKGYRALGRDGYIIVAPALVINDEEVEMILNDFDEIFTEMDKLA